MAGVERGERKREGVDAAEEVGVGERNVGGGVNEDGGGGGEVGRGVEERENVVGDGERGGFRRKRDFWAEAPVGFGGGAVSGKGIH